MGIREFPKKYNNNNNNNNTIKFELIRIFFKSWFGWLELSANIWLNPYNPNIIFKLLYCHYC